MMFLIKITFNYELDLSNLTYLRIIKETVVILYFVKKIVTEIVINKKYLPKFKT